MLMAIAKWATIGVGALTAGVLVTSVALAVQLRNSDPLASIATDEAAAFCSDHIADFDDSDAVTGVLEADSALASDVVFWQEQRHAPEGTGIRSPLRSVVSNLDEQVYVCIYEGLFTAPAGPSGKQHTSLTMIFVPGSGPLFDSAGHVEHFSSFRQWWPDHQK
jgi:hypothetical protein